jgi:hypothetical protein
MKTLLIALIACAPFTTKICKAEDYPKYNLTMQVHTHHVQRTQFDGTAWNEDNRGLGMEAELNRNWTMAAGYFKNSYSLNTMYAGVRYSPTALQWFSGKLQLGAALALASGYDVPVVGGITITTPWFGIILAPKAGARTSAFGSVALRVPL